MIHLPRSIILRCIVVVAGAFALAILLSAHHARRADALGLAPVTGAVQHVTAPVTTVWCSTDTVPRCTGEQRRAEGHPTGHERRPPSRRQCNTRRPVTKTVTHVAAPVTKTVQQVTAPVRPRRDVAPSPRRYRTDRHARRDDRQPIVLPERSVPHGTRPSISTTFPSQTQTLVPTINVANGAASTTPTSAPTPSTPTPKFVSHALNAASLATTTAPAAPAPNAPAPAPARTPPSTTTTDSSSAPSLSLSFAGGLAAFLAAAAVVSLMVRRLQLLRTVRPSLLYASLLECPG